MTSFIFVQFVFFSVRQHGNMVKLRHLSPTPVLWCPGEQPNLVSVRFALHEVDAVAKEAVGSDLTAQDVNHVFLIKYETLSRG